MTIQRDNNGKPILPKMKRTAVKQSTFGVYCWGMPDGKLVADENGDWLNIPAEKGDRVKMGIIRDVVLHYGIIVGEPVFMPGRRRITDQEFIEQKERLALGLTPDIYDAGALLDELDYNKKVLGR